MSLEIQQLSSGRGQCCRAPAVLEGLAAAPTRAGFCQQRRKPAVVSGVPLWSGRIRSTTPTPVIPQLRLPRLCQDVCRCSDSRRCRPGAAPHRLRRRRWSGSEQPPPARGEPRPGRVPCQQLGCSWLLSCSGRAVVSLVSAQKRQQEHSGDVGEKKVN